MKMQASSSGPLLAQIQADCRKTSPAGILRCRQGRSKAVLSTIGRTDITISLAFG